MEEKNEKIIEMEQPMISNAWQFFYNMVLPRVEKEKKGDMVNYRKVGKAAPCPLMH